MYLTIKYRQEHGDTLYSWDYTDSNGYVLAMSHRWFDSSFDAYDDFLWTTQGIKASMREAFTTEI
ncbi:hypothetical protein [Exercitatus varius]|uniref:hypothetical protein n=1 Tax=Exercitatus varius TaxID=67857 RepID=UPI00294AA9A9|nr:hypothetical protein [Exercitatus varius]MDG2961693.1 hypothetical protein [Exercitatus varius]